MPSKYNINKDRLTPYLLCFILCIVGGLIYKDYLLFNKIYIYNDIGSDTLNSYWAYFHYFVEEIQRGNIPLWMDSVALGTNLFSVASFILDPFHLILLFFKPDNLVYVLPYIAVLKIVIAGLLFYYFLKSFSFSNFALIIGSLLYGLNGYLILWGQHHSFGTFMALLPLALLGFEKWIKNKQYMLFIVSTAILSGMNFYLFVMFTMFLIVYAVYRFISEKPELQRNFVVFTIKTTGLYLIGMGISGLLIFPTIYALLTNSRVSGSSIPTNIFEFDQPIMYISTFFRMFSNDMLTYGDQFYGWVNYYEDPMLYCGLITLLVIPYLFFKTKEKQNKINAAFISILVVFLIFPIFTYMFNAFSSEQKRWTFMVIISFCLLATYSIDYIVKHGISNITPFTKILSYLGFIGVTLAFLGFVIGWNSDQVIVTISRLIKALILMALYGILLFFLKNQNYSTIAKVILISLISAELFIQANAAVNNRSSLDAEVLQEKVGYYDYTNEAIKFIEEKDTGYYRVDKDYLSVFYADSIFQGYRGFNSYNSLNTPSYVNFLRELEVPFKIKDHNNYITGLDDRLILETLLSSKYFLTKNRESAPYGYQYIEQVGDIYIYENEYSLPIGITYSNYILESEFNNLPSYMKDISLTQAAVISEELDIKNNDIRPLVEQNSVYRKLNIENTDITSLNAEIIQKGNLNKIEVESLSNDPQLIVKLADNISNHSINTIMKLNINISDMHNGQIFWRKEGQPYSEENAKSFIVSPGENSYSLNLGYIDADEIRIDFSEAPGQAILSNIELLGLSPNDYIESMERLSNEGLVLDEYSNNKITGNITVSSEKILVFSIPFDEGWNIKLNGKTTEIVNTNLGFLGVELDEGEYNIELKYSPPYLKLGAIVSIVSLLVLLIVLFRRNSKKK